MMRCSCRVKGKTDLLAYLDDKSECFTCRSQQLSTSHEVEAPPSKTEMCLISGEAVYTVSGDLRKVVSFGIGSRLAEECFMRSYDHWAMEVKV
jgi:hypothetical protein